MKRANKLILAFDNPGIDAAGAKASLDMLDRTRKEGMECWFLNYGQIPYKDIGDMPEDVVRSCIEGSKHSVFGEGAIYG